MYEIELGFFSYFFLSREFFFFFKGFNKKILIMFKNNFLYESF